MDKSKSQEFAARVTQASRSELIVVIYDVILEDIAEAGRIIGWNETAEPVFGSVGNITGNYRLTGAKAEEFKRVLMHASRFINELMASLDFHYRLSYELRSLYIYVNGKLLNMAFSGRGEALSECKKILLQLREAFVAVAGQDHTGPVMKNTQHLTAGLTYGRGNLNEICVDAGAENRGYLV